jgi:hypothetical protein
MAGVAAVLIAKLARDDPDATTTAASSTAIFAVTLDPSGRPYDVALPSGATVERRRLAVLHAPSREVIFLGGEAVPYVTAGDYVPVTLAERPGRRASSGSGDRT